MNIDEVMNFINSYSRSGSPVKDLSRFRRLMNELGDPQDKLTFIHAAGTNGKGSVTRMLSEIFRRAGYRTGEFTSPFIYRYNDRISIDGAEISDGDLCAVISKIIPSVKRTRELGYSQFEITCAAAFIYFLEKKCDIVILETGLGGLLDCTNIINYPVCSVITSISYDHTDILGNSLSEIARHKAGIMKRNSPCVLQCANPPEAVAVMEERAEELNIKLIVPNLSRLKIISSDYTGNEFSYKGKKLRTSMAGRHQIYNALTAYEAALCARKQGFDISAGDIADGIYRAAVPSRCQIIRGAAPMVILDGAHNPDGMRALSELVKNIRRSPKVMICGMLESKDWRTALDFISPYIDKAYCVDGFYRNAVFAPKLAEYFRNGEAADLGNVYEMAAAYAGNNGLVVIGGSLYLAAAVRKSMGIDREGNNYGRIS